MNNEERTALIERGRVYVDLLRSSVHIRHEGADLIEEILSALESVSRRLVTTINEAALQPLNTVLRDAQGDIWERFVEPGGSLAWRTTVHVDPLSSNWIALPATVLWSPAPEGNN